MENLNRILVAVILTLLAPGDLKLMLMVNNINYVRSNLC